MAPGLTVEDSPIEMLLKEQATLQTPVGVFSEQHASGAVEPEQAKFYKQLIPLSKPQAGEQYAFKVDLDKCTGCKACVSACHNLNGLDAHETWRDVGTIHGGSSEAPYAQTVTTACHHCADPGCLNGCPVLAYEKDEDTGIVRHLDDQCIGCQYCILKCPYDVPKYSKSLGIVRKCDMCHSRLADGEAPACVQACPTEAISITIVDTHATVAAAKKEHAFLAGAPDPAYTVPTTVYETKREVPADTGAADRLVLKPEHAHLPLVFMLVLTQLSVGLFLLSLFVWEGFALSLKLGGFVALLLGLGASTSHLGRPLGAWRAFLGLRRSWLSREIVGFGGLFGLAAVYTLGSFFSWPVEAVGYLTAVMGLLSVFTSVMIYHDTQRVFWRLPVSAGKFFGTTLGLGLAGAALASESSGWALAAGGLFAVKFALEASQLTAAKTAEFTPAKKSALLMLKPLKNLLMARFGLGLAGVFVMLLGATGPLPLLWLGCLLLLAGEFCERGLFFKAVVALKMPGGLTL